MPSEMPIVKQKWKSVDIVAKITETMRNVAAGKLPSSEKWLKNTRPFAASTGPFFETEQPLPDIKKRLHLVVGCERGLCGVVGSNLPKIVTKEVREQRKKNPDVAHEVVVLGKKTTTKLKGTLKDDVTEGFVGMKSRMPTFPMMLLISDTICKTREFEEVSVYYNIFKNTQTFYPQTKYFYNLELSQKISKLQCGLYEEEGDPLIIMQNLYEFRMAAMLYNCAAEQQASEMGSRFASMDGASKTCKEKSKEYESTYQTLRKTKITNELTVLSTGAKLAKGGG